MKYVTFIIFYLFAVTGAQAQVSTVSLQASGLTCSMCSNAINKSLRTLVFVDSIHADIKTYTFIIYCRPGSEPDFGIIKKKVEDAGFSVAGLTAAISFNNRSVSGDRTVIVGRNKLIFAGTSPVMLRGTVNIKLLDKGFVTSTEYKRLRLAVPAEGTYHVTI